MSINIVLYQPQIPQNTGNIARTCVLTDATLHLIKPLSFDISDKQVKRSGLDYWDELKLEVHESYEEFMKKYGDRNIYLATTHGGEHYDEVEYKDGDFIMFGRETCGVPEDVHNAHEGIRIPMIKSSTRSLNLSNTAAIVAYEALRQLGFPNMK
ncbi:tRNA (cytidine(34)-2'-O)-methyltransferase [Clostridium chrysemydis]|uniref:tRNA (cytidine(34)-2'-O)-methyltransferase n=1 Tax=Clostridium chrysemydis TaxID=2665504 RepID=UPI0018845643|nr:tRNA (cytidine(34)-2'-O)-methyltransferase [Clostridium chrysemydis]